MISTPLKKWWTWQSDILAAYDVHNTCCLQNPEHALWLWPWPHYNKVSILTRSTSFDNTFSQKISGRGWCALRHIMILVYLNISVSYVHYVGVTDHRPCHSKRLSGFIFFIKFSRRVWFVWDFPIFSCYIKRI